MQKDRSFFEALELLTFQNGSRNRTSARARLARHGLLDCKTRRFATQDTAFCDARHDLLQRKTRRFATRGCPSAIALVNCCGHPTPQDGHHPALGKGRACRFPCRFPPSAANGDWLFTILWQRSRNPENGVGT